MLYYFNTEEEFLRAYREAFKAYRESYNTPYSRADRDVTDLYREGLRKFGWEVMVLKLAKPLKAIKEEVVSEMG